MSEMVRRVALAIGEAEAEAEGAAVQDWYWEKNLPRLKLLARAAIEAMRNPTEDMISVIPLTEQFDGAQQYHAMINKALDDADPARQGGLTKPSS